MKKSLSFAPHRDPSLFKYSPAREKLKVKELLYRQN